MQLSNHCARKIQNQENNHSRITITNTIQKAHFISALSQISLTPSLEIGHFKEDFFYYLQLSLENA